MTWSAVYRTVWELYLKGLNGFDIVPLRRIRWNHREVADLSMLFSCWDEDFSCLFIYNSESLKYLLEVSIKHCFRDSGGN